MLASSSPRRQLLLRSLGIDFIVAVADIDETALAGECPVAMARRLATAKAEAVSALCPDSCVLAADTIVVLNGRVLGKPRDRNDAVQMLQSLAGRVHEVYTAVALIGKGATRVEVEGSEVWLRAYGAEEIAAYVASGDPLDKAGAYAVQSRDFRPVARVGGCYANVMGLPLALVVELLATVGIAPRYSVPTVCHKYFGRCCLDAPGCS